MFQLQLITVFWHANYENSHYLSTDNESSRYEKITNTIAIKYDISISSNILYYFQNMWVRGWGANNKNTIGGNKYHRIKIIFRIYKSFVVSGMTYSAEKLKILRRISGKNFEERTQPSNSSVEWSSIGKEESQEVHDQWGREGRSWKDELVTWGVCKINCSFCRF